MSRLSLRQPLMLQDLLLGCCCCWAEARFPFKRNRLRCVRCVNKNRKRFRWQAANHGCHCFDRAFLLAACQRKRLCFLRFSFTQRTQRKRLRLNGNWAWRHYTQLTGRRMHGTTDMRDPTSLANAIIVTPCALAAKRSWPAANHQSFSQSLVSTHEVIS